MHCAMFCSDAQGFQCNCCARHTAVPKTPRTSPACPLPDVLPLGLLPAAALRCSAVRTGTARYKRCGEAWCHWAPSMPRGAEPRRAAQNGAAARSRAPRNAPARKPREPSGLWRGASSLDVAGSELPRPFRGGFRAASARNAPRTPGFSPPRPARDPCPRVASARASALPSARLAAGLGTLRPWPQNPASLGPPRAGIHRGKAASRAVAIAPSKGGNCKNRAQRLVFGECFARKLVVWPAKRMDTLGIEPRAFRMRSGCDATTPCALL